MAVGAADDRWEIGPLAKLAGQITAGGIVVWSGAFIGWVPLPGGGSVPLELDNVQPARIFMGDSGSMLLGLQSPFQADRLHLHHRLLDLGHSHRRTVLLMWLWAALFAGLVVGLAVIRIPLVWFALATVAAVAGLALATAPRHRPWRSAAADVAAARSGTVSRVTDAPALAWIQPDPDSGGTGPEYVVLGIRVGGNDGERLVQQVMAAAHQVDEETFAMLPDDLACEVTATEGTVTVHLTAGSGPLAALARGGEEWRARVARLLPDGSRPDRVRLLTAVVPRPGGGAELAPGVVVIDFEHGVSPADVLAAVSDGETAYTLVGPEPAATP